MKKVLLSLLFATSIVHADGKLWNELPRLDSGQETALLESMSATCKTKHSALTAFCDQIAVLKPSDVNTWLNSRFNPKLLITGDGNTSGMMTSYLKIPIDISLEKNDIFKYPIYRVPDGKDLHYTRNYIDTHSELFKDFVTAYAKNYWDIYAMQIQGSGEGKLPDGSVLSFSYGAKNGYNHTGLGPTLIKKGVFKSIEEMTFPAVQKYMLSLSPDSQRKLLAVNQAFLFFNVSEGTTETVGKLGTKLVPFASAAVDPDKIPLGSLLYVTGTTIDNQPYTGVVVAADVDAAIKTNDYPFRIDLFVDDITFAGNMNDPDANAWILEPQSNSTDQ